MHIHVEKTSKDDFDENYDTYRKEFLIKMQKSRIIIVFIFWICSISLILLSIWLYGKASRYHCSLVAFSGGVHFTLGLNRLVEWQLERRSIKAERKLYERMKAACK